jgi:hypothetical protein
MKKQILSLAIAVFCIFGTSLVAQTSLKEGYVKMEITDATSDDEQMAMGLEMMKGTQTEIFFNGEKYVTKMSMMGGMVEVKTFVSNKDDQFNMLMDAMGNKMWVNSTIDDAEKANQQDLAKGATVTYDQDDTKEIAGYKCYKATITNKEAADMVVTGYVTRDIVTDANIIQGLQSLKLEGFPLEFTVKNSMMTITMSAVDVKNKLSASDMEMKTDGYKKMTMDEFQKSMGGMGGGMGF